MKLINKITNRLFLAAVIGSLYLPTTADAGSCYCYRDFWCHGWGKQEEVPGTRVSTDTREDKAQSGPFFNGSNPRNGSKPQQFTCSIGSGSDFKDEWSISGGVDCDVFGAKYTSTKGGSKAYSWSASANVVVDFWCQCCHLEAGLTKRTTTLQAECVLTYGCTCINGPYSGTNVEYVGTYVGNHDPECTVPRPCSCD